jgi:hypothetical protein
VLFNSRVVRVRGLWAGGILNAGVKVGRGVGAVSGRHFKIRV